MIKPQWQLPNGRFTFKRTGIRFKHTQWPTGRFERTLPIRATYGVLDGPGTVSRETAVEYIILLSTIGFAVLSIDAFERPTQRQEIAAFRSQAAQALGATVQKFPNL